MFKFLLSLLPDFLKVYLGIKESTAEDLGSSKEDDDILRNALKTMNAEDQAGANAPQDKTQMEKLLQEHKI